MLAACQRADPGADAQSIDEPGRGQRERDGDEHVD